MRSIIGIFPSLKEAENAVYALKEHGIKKENINLLIPSHAEEDIEVEVESIPTVEGERPGMGKVVGGVVGGVAGLSGGMQLGTVASLLIPGIGPVVAVGLAAGALLGVGGLVGGAAVGDALEEKLADGVPRDDIFIYEEVLRLGNSVIVVMAESKKQEDTVREIFESASAADPDTTRERWWDGLRNKEAEYYEKQGGDFESDEPAYRRGFEATLLPDRRGKSYEEVKEDLKKRYPDIYDTEAFQRGYERGQAYYGELISERQESA